MGWYSSSSSSSSIYVLDNLSEVTALLLFEFERDEKRLEVACSKSLMVVSLDDFVEESRSILHRLGEDLEEVALLIVVHEDVILLEHIDVFCDLNRRHRRQVLAEVVVVGRWDGEELNASSAEGFNGGDNFRSVERDVLHTRTSIVVNVLLDLRLSLAISRLVDRHFNLLVEVSHHDRSQRRELSVNHTVIHTPEAVEVKFILIPTSSRFHLIILCQSNNRRLVKRTFYMALSATSLS